MRNSWSSVFFIVSTVVSVQLIGAQFFDPKVNDKEYLDSIQNNVVEEVSSSKAELIDQAKIIQIFTKNYIAAKLKQNLFKALRVLAEKELAFDAMTMQDRPRQPRQDDDGDEDGAGKPNQLLPQVANLIKAVFGGNINLTSYVESASKLLPKPVGAQLVGVVKLLGTNPGDKYTTTTPTTTTSTTTSTTTTSTTTVAPSTIRQIIKLVSAGPASSQTLPPNVIIREVYVTAEPATTEVSSTAGDEDEDEDEFDSPQIYEKQQSNVGGLRQLPGLDFLGNIGGVIGNILSGGSRNKDNDKDSAKSKQPDNNNKNKTADASSGSAEESSSGMTSMANKMSGIDVGGLAKEVRNGLGDLIKVMPDIFRGAHEAYKLLSSVSQLFSRLDAEP